MGVVLKPIAQGRQCRIYALADESRCLLADFLADVERDLADEFPKLVRLFDYAAEHLPPRNEEKCKLLQDGIYEFKTTRLRVLWFWDEGRMILCTHGFVKKSRKTPPGEITRALKMKAGYEVAKQARQLKFESL